MAPARHLVLELCRHWPNQTQATVPGGHFLPEDAPDQFATVLASWLDTLTVEANVTAEH